jgi:hypothetical protein
MLRYVVAILFLAAVATPALAQGGCGNFKWKLEKEHALLTSTSAAKTSNGAEQGALPATALALSLEPAAAAKLATPPERAPKQPSTFAGYVRFAGAPVAQTILVTLSAEAWIDLVQGGHYVKPTAFSGVHDCATMRKSIKFELAPGPFAVQLSGVAAETINMTVTPAGE